MQRLEVLTWVIGQQMRSPVSDTADAQTSSNAARMTLMLSGSDFTAPPADGTAAVLAAGAAPGLALGHPAIALAVGTAPDLALGRSAPALAVEATPELGLEPAGGGLCVAGAALGSPPGHCVLVSVGSTCLTGGARS